ncbi:hypothetical protein [Actinomadura formosensis]|uniref:hypothetical protein n=1 Tax=Actinomadura formosensis TaxID=60706 RepID=UPI00082D19E7|nr:hypothetical protein [Actinomadura formosensis]
MTVEQDTPGGAPFFHHAQTAAEAAQQPLQNTTRYLCAAVYLDRRICDRVISEFLDDENRAVVPSFGFDLEPVILHALRARRYRLIRDLVLCGIWTVALILLPLIAVGLFMFALVLSAFYAIPWRRLSPGMRLLVGWVAVNAVGVVVAAAVVPVVGAQLVENAGYTTHELEQDKGALELLQTDLAVPSLIMLTLALSMTVIGHLAAVYAVLARDLAPGATGPGPRAFGERAGKVVTRVRSAQRGNVTLHSGTNPFIGAGDLTSPWARAWSIVLELDRPASGRVDLVKHGDDAAGPSRVDPMVMHMRVRDRLHAMRDERPTGEHTAGLEDLPPNERITALLTGMHIAGRGESVQRMRPADPAIATSMPPHPLIDPAHGCPFSMATPEAVDALVRHPQSHIRCFQRITVGAHGQAVLSRDGRVVAAAEEQDISLTAFVYLAVEGRMLYGNFAATVLPPVRREFRIVDLLPTWSTATQLFYAFKHGWRTVLSGMLLPGVRTVATCWATVRSVIAAASAHDSARRMVHDYGARISVRELCAAADFDTYVQEMDADKYTRLIEWRVNEALLDYLGDECGIDVSAYRTQAGVIMNEGVIITGGTVNGQVAGGKRIDQRQGGPGRVNP